MFGRKDKKSVPEEANESIQLGDAFLIPESEVPDSQKGQFLSALEMTRGIIDEFQQRNGSIIEMPILYEDDTGKIKMYKINHHLPLKTENENLLWYRTVFEGLVNKKLRAYQVVTNHRVYVYDLKSGTPNACPLFGNMEVIVNNQKRVSESQRDGTFGGMGARGTFVGSSTGYSTSESHTLGDINILDPEGIILTLYNVADPHGVAKLIRYVISNVVDLETKMQKQNSQKVFSTQAKESPLAILKTRLAKGEISRQEYEELSKILSD